jgi:hypothetical protein
MIIHRNDYKRFRRSLGGTPGGGRQHPVLATASWIEQKKLNRQNPRLNESPKKY